MATEQKTTIGIKDIAAKLECEPSKLRAFIRKSDLPAVGKGKRYEWASLSDPSAKAVMAAWRSAQKETA
jgi:hypothetical protein